MSANMMATPMKTHLNGRSCSVRFVAPLRLAAAFLTSATPRLMPEDQALAHPAEREAGTHQHAADGDRADDVPLHMSGQRDPGRVGCHVAVVAA